MPILGITASSILKITDTGAMDPLQVITVGPSGASSVTFTNIPSTYAHLQIRATLKQSIGSAAFARFNSDTGSNYARHRLIGTGASAGAYGEASQNKVQINTSQGYPSFGVFIMDILDYANTNKYKTERHLFGLDENGSGQIGLESNLWQSSSAITSIEFISPNGGNYSQYSQFALYGIKGAE